jgi:lysophospholipase L1-like esterase
MIKSWPSSSNPKKSVTVALLTPPPCDTQIMSASRNNEDFTSLYAQAVLKVGAEMNVPVVDLWNGMQLPTSAESTFDTEEYGDTWKKEYLSDGLHLTPLGNYRLYQLVVEMLERPLHASDTEDSTVSGLGLSLKQLPRHYPDHSLVDAENPEKTFGQGS